MPTFDPHQIANLVGQLGGDHQQAAQVLSNVGGQVDPQQHADLLQQVGVDPRQLQTGGYQQHLDQQNQPGFQGYQPGADLSRQTPKFGRSAQQGSQYAESQAGYGSQGSQYAESQAGYGSQGGQDAGYGDRSGQQNY